VVQAAETCTAAQGNRRNVAFAETSVEKLECMFSETAELQAQSWNCLQ
jgi:hypothetical protein